MNKNIIWGSMKVIHLINSSVFWSDVGQFSIIQSNTNFLTTVLVIIVLDLIVSLGIWMWTRIITSIVFVSRTVQTFIYRSFYWLIDQNSGVTSRNRSNNVFKYITFIRIVLVLYSFIIIIIIIHICYLLIMLSFGLFCPNWHLLICFCIFLLVCLLKHIER